MSEEKRSIFVLVRLGGESAVMSRIRESVPKVKSVIERLSNNNCQLIFTTSDGTSFGYFMKTSVPLRVLRAEIYGTSESSTGGSPLLTGDKYIAFEVGDDFDGVGFSRGWTWLQHHHQ